MTMEMISPCVRPRMISLAVMSFPKNQVSGKKPGF
jgi:hypothetical protein